MVKGNTVTLFQVSNEKIVGFLRSTSFKEQREKETAEELASLLSGEQKPDYAGYAENYLRTFITAFWSYQRTVPLTQEWRVYLLSFERAEKLLHDVLIFAYKHADSFSSRSALNNVLTAIRREFDR